MLQSETTLTGPHLPRVEGGDGVHVWVALTRGDTMDERPEGTDGGDGGDTDSAPPVTRTAHTGGVSRHDDIPLTPDPGLDRRGRPE